jgi:hypothetical protein
VLFQPAHPWILIGTNLLNSSGISAIFPVLHPFPFSYFEVLL